MTVDQYNKTQLHPETIFEKHVFHRDQFAHYLRWSHVLHFAKAGMNVLDVGCGSGNLLEVFWRNRYTPKKYVGIDVRGQTIQKLNELWKPKVDFAKFFALDIVKEPPPQDQWDIICCFEVLEHIGRENGPAFLHNIKQVMNPSTVFLLSTPCFDPRVGAADNHMIEGEVGEWTFKDLKKLLEFGFKVHQVNGTFASQKDIRPTLTGHELRVWEDLKKYYDSELMSVLFAPLHPEASRNCIWTLGLKT